MIEIAKWLVPIICRGPGIDIIHTSLVFHNKDYNPGMNFPDFPPEMVSTKLELATNYLTVLHTIEPGLSKFRAKFTYEVIDTKIYIFSRRFQETGEANIKELQGKPKAIKKLPNLSPRIVPKGSPKKKPFW